MATTVWNVMRSLAGVESGRWCRGCGDSIARRDDFGRSEGFCPACRVGSPEPR